MTNNSTSANVTEAAWKCWTCGGRLFAYVAGSMQPNEHRCVNCKAIYPEFALTRLSDQAQPVSDTPSPDQGFEYAQDRLTKMADHGRIDSAYGDFAHPSVTMIADVRKLLAALSRQRPAKDTPQ